MKSPVDARKDFSTPCLESFLKTFLGEPRTSSSPINPRRNRSSARTSTGIVQQLARQSTQSPSVYRFHVEGRSLSELLMRLFYSWNWTPHFASIASLSLVDRPSSFVSHAASSKASPIQLIVFTTAEETPGSAASNAGPSDARQAAEPKAASTAVFTSANPSTQRSK